MKLSIGELPDHHPFLLITRPLVDWTFKIVTWLVIAATFRVAAEATKNAYLIGLAWLSILLVTLFMYGFVSWLLSFSRFGIRPDAQVISGEELVAAAGPEATSIPDLPVKRRTYWLGKARAFLAIFLAVIFSIIFTAGSNILAEQIISAIVEFQKQSRTH